MLRFARLRQQVYDSSFEDTFCVLATQMLQSALRDSACQLVRLGVAGNALGDAGLAALAPGLQVPSYGLTRYSSLFYQVKFLGSLLFSVPSSQTRR